MPIYYKQKEDELKNKQVVRNMSTRELVLQRKLEKKLEEENYKKNLKIFIVHIRRCQNSKRFIFYYPDASSAGDSSAGASACFWPLVLILVLFLMMLLVLL